MQEIFTEEFLKEIGFQPINDTLTEQSEGVIGKALDTKTNKTKLLWNNEGCQTTLNGEPLKPNVALAIYKDSGTRAVFFGYVFTQDDVRKLLSLTA